jgi:hypothetical protein
MELTPAGIRKAMAARTARKRFKEDDEGGKK